MNEVIKAAADLDSFCAARGWQRAFIGGLAVLRWGEPRETVDVDLTLLTGFGAEQPFIDALLKRYQARLPNAGQFAAERRVLLVQAQSGVGLDIALGGLPFEEELIARATPFAFPGGIQLPICSAEDLIVLKTFAGRPKDWMDIEGVIIRQMGTLDWPYIHGQLAPLLELKETPEVWDELLKLKVRLAQDP